MIRHQNDKWILDIHTFWHPLYKVEIMRSETAHGPCDIEWLFVVFVVFFWFFSSPPAFVRAEKRLNVCCMLCAVRVSETLSRSPKRNRFDECIVIILTIAVRITCIHSIPSTVNWYHMVAWFPFGTSQLLAFRFQLTGMYVLRAIQPNKTVQFIVYLTLLLLSVVFVVVVVVSHLFVSPCKVWCGRGIFAIYDNNVHLGTFFLLCRLYFWLFFVCWWLSNILLFWREKKMYSSSKQTKKLQKCYMPCLYYASQV